jgi:catechol 1,2-dioxygenase
MPANLIRKDVITALAARAAGLEKPDGNPRLKQVVNRLLIDLMTAIDELDISMDEFWTGVAYFTRAGKQNEFGLIVPGVVLEHFLDLRLDEAERRAGLSGGTVRTIEGPLCPGISDVDLFRYREGIIYLNAEVSHSAFNLGVAQELHGP